MQSSTVNKLQRAVFRGFWNFERKYHHHGKMLITLLFVPQKQPN